MNNIFRCFVCGRHAISEEKDLHECRPLRDFEVVGDTLRVFDGSVWYPLKLDQATRRFLTRRISDVDLTEPKIGCKNFINYPKNMKNIQIK